MNKNDMKIYVPLKDKDGLGGGWTFTRNILKGLRNDVEFVNNWKDCDIYFITGPTLAQRDEVLQAKSQGKKIVLRVDNVPRNSRNRNTSTSRLYDFAQIADEVIYQSKWAQGFVGGFTKREGVIILNGTDTDIFKPDGDKIDKQGKPQYIYSKYSSDPVKRWEKTWYDFQRDYFNNNESHLWIVGRAEFFGKDQEEYKFDLFGGAEKRYKYFGLVQNPVEMAKLYRSADYLYMPYDLDACSNVVVEARMCGLNIVWNGEKDNSVYEILKAPKEYLTLEGMSNKYLEVFKRIIK